MYRAIEYLTKRPLIVIALAAAVSTVGIVGYAVASRTGSPPITIGSSHPEVLTLDSYSITYDNGQPNPTVLSMVVRNSGTISVTMSTLTVQDLTTGASSPTFSLNSQTIPAPDKTSTVNYDTLSSGFCFVHGHTYSFVIITSKQTHFSFGPFNFA